MIQEIWRKQEILKKREKQNSRVEKESDKETRRTYAGWLADYLT
tara:strand:- start:140 stop:271 length:132 start_codon:yes stop_codon:yes gene_type:complete